MGASRIEQLIEDIYEFVESCRMQPLSSTKVIVPKDELYDLLDELRLRTPEEIKRYQKIIANRDAILSDAEEQAQNVLAQTKEKATDLINEHEIMQQAYYQANEMITEATNEANRIRQEAMAEADELRRGALSYTNDLLEETERVFENAYDTSKAKYESFIEILKNNLDIIHNNKKEIEESLAEQNEPQAAATQEVPEQVAAEEEEQKEADEDFNFNEDTFLEDIE